jgi:hypothetical protein
MATFTHITEERCAQLGKELTATGLPWQDNGRNRPEFLTYTFTDAHDRQWSVSPATSNQITPSRPASIWQATLSSRHTSPVMGARALAAHIRDFPAGPPDAALATR